MASCGPIMAIAAVENILDSAGDVRSCAELPDLSGC
jgi:hypothetical protein